MHLTLATASSVQEAAGEIETAFGLSPGSVNLLVDGDALRVAFTAVDVATQSVPLFENLAQWEAESPTPNLAGITTLIAAGGGNTVNVTANGTFVLDLGIDLSDPANPTGFLYDTSQLTVDTHSRHNGNLNFSATLGAVSFTVVGGSRTFDADGNPNTIDSATFTATFGDPNLTGRLDFDQLVANTLTGQTGQLQANYPLRDVDSGDLVGNLVLSVTNLGNPDGWQRESFFARPECLRRRG